MLGSSRIPESIFLLYSTTLSELLTSGNKSSPSAVYSTKVDFLFRLRPTGKRKNKQNQFFSSCFLLMFHLSLALRIITLLGCFSGSLKLYGNTFTS